MEVFNPIRLWIRLALLPQHFVGETLVMNGASTFIYFALLECAGLTADRTI